MSSRALSLATVVLLIGFGAIDGVLAQATNLEAGKTPSQLFAQTCNVCHKSPRGLLKSVAPGSLPGFLRQHYTTSSDMAGVLASYLVSNGATDTRYQAKDGGKDKKDGKDKEAAGSAAPASDHQGRRQRSPEAARPDGEAAQSGEPTRQKRAARPSEDAAKDGVGPDGQAASEGRKGKRSSKRGKPETDETPKTNAADEKKGEARPETAKTEPESKPAKPVEARPETKVEPASETPAMRADPVPPVTPAPPAAVAKPAEAAPAAKPQDAAPPTTAAAPPADAGPPAPPISR